MLSAHSSDKTFFAIMKPAKEVFTMKSLFEQMGGTYTQWGDYLLPDIELPPPSAVL